MAVTATRTGAGKSQTSRLIRQILADAGLRVAAIRHPMPYGDLNAQRVQRLGSFADLDAAEVTIEEREEYEPYIRQGAVIYAGVDYGDILAAAEQEADVIIWDGGNNDLPFYKVDLAFCVVDPFRAGHELRYWPGEANLRHGRCRRSSTRLIPLRSMGSRKCRRNVAALAPNATVIEAASPIAVDDASVIKGKRVLCSTTGPPSPTGRCRSVPASSPPGSMAQQSSSIPRPFAVGSLVGVFEKYPHIGSVLPAMGYSDVQRKELQETITAAAPEAIVIGTPIDLAGVIDLGDIPSTRVYYELEVNKGPSLEELLQPIIEAARG